MANGRNGLDVDKFDYLQRDSLYCNVKINADFDRLQKFSKVASGTEAKSCLILLLTRTAFRLLSTRPSLQHCFFAINALVL